MRKKREFFSKKIRWVYKKIEVNFAQSVICTFAIRNTYSLQNTHTQTLEKWLRL